MNAEFKKKSKEEKILNGCWNKKSAETQQVIRQPFLGSH